MPSPSARKGTRGLPGHGREMHSSPVPSKVVSADKYARCVPAAQVYDGQRFVKGGFRMHELFFHDGTCPSDAILQRFLTIAEAEPGPEGCAPGAPREQGLPREYLPLRQPWRPSSDCRSKIKLLYTGLHANSPRG